MQAVFDAIGSFFTFLLKLITDWAGWLLNVIKQIFLDIWEFFTDIPVWIFEQIMNLVLYIIGSLPFPEPPNYWSGLPAEILNIMGLIGISEALAMILAALTIRILLQLIPFTRLGS